MEGEAAEVPTPVPTTVGEKLRAARLAHDLELPEIAARTRIPQRHLEAIEASDYSGLPSVTYALGFVRAYARAVGADEVALARQLRTELGNYPERAAPTPAYEMTDPTRLPPRGLVWAGVIVALLLLVGALWYGTGLFHGNAPADTQTATDMGDAPANASVPVALPSTVAPSGGQVTLVALDTVWVRVNDGDGKRLFEKEMAEGERYDVPAGTPHPHVRTGRPDKLQVLLNGSQVAPLGAPAQTVDIDVSADALRARGQSAPGGAGSNSSAP